MLYVTVKPDSWFRPTKYVKSTFGRVSDLNLKLKYHSSETAFTYFATANELPIIPIINLVTVQRGASSCVN